MKLIDAAVYQGQLKQIPDKVTYATTVSSKAQNIKLFKKVDSHTYTYYHKH